MDKTGKFSAQTILADQLKQVNYDEIQIVQTMLKLFINFVYFLLLQYITR